MAAALDAMRPYGYDDDLILKTVKELLDVSVYLFMFIKLLIFVLTTNVGCGVWS